MSILLDSTFMDETNYPESFTHFFMFQLIYSSSVHFGGGLWGIAMAPVFMQHVGIIYAVDLQSLIVGGVIYCAEYKTINKFPTLNHEEGRVIRVIARHF